MQADRPTEQRVCPTHGEYIATHYHYGRPGGFWTGCPTCKDEEHAKREAESRRVEAGQQQRQRFAGSGLVGRFAAATFDTYAVASSKQAEVLGACQDFASGLNHRSWGAPWLIGPVGTGKTHLGAAMVHSVILAGNWAHMTSARGIIQRLRATWAKGSAETEEGVLDELAMYSLLVIDEIGIGFGSEAEMTQLFDVIDRRYQLCRPVVLLSNLNQPAIKTALGDRLFDRMREGAQILVCDWPSHRRGAP